MDFSGSRWRSPEGPIEKEALAALEYCSSFNLSSERRRHFGAVNPPFRTPLDIWSRATITAQRLANPDVYRRLDQNPADIESLDAISELQEIQILPVPTSQPIVNVFSRLLDETDGLFSPSPPDVEHEAASKVEDLDFTLKYSPSRTNTSTAYFSDSSFTLQQCFCGPDAGMSTRLYDKYIRLVKTNGVVRARWETQVKVVELHGAAQNMLQNIRLRPKDSSTEIADFFSHFREQITKLENFVDVQMSQLLSDENMGKQESIKEPMAVFAHITALKQAYEHELKPPLWSSSYPHRHVFHTRPKGLRKSVAFSQSVAIVTIDSNGREIGPTEALEMPIDNAAGSFSSSLLLPQSSKIAFEHNDLATGDDNCDSEDVRQQMLDMPTLFDTQSVDSESNSARMSEEWLRSFTNRTQLLLKTRRRQADERIRIAILDTGIDLDHPEIAKSKARILDCRSWVAVDPSPTDTCGHGTHIASVILKMAPWAHLYIARVFRNGDEVEVAAAAAVALAINHARTQWKVDILSISFGFRTYQTDIEAALTDCIEAKPPVLVFAAAANTGAREARPAFPAGMNSVFCINSASGDGVPSSFNPPMRRGNDNFTFLGEAISGAWPANLKHSKFMVSGPRKTLSGTSLATPVAASIAALVLEFCRQQPQLLPESVTTRVRTYDGMREVFRETMLSSEDRSDMLIQPWGLLDARVNDNFEEARRIAADKLASAMRAAFGV